MHSAGKQVVYAFGLSHVVLTLRMHAPWGGEPLGMPVNVRLFRKGGKSYARLAAKMIGAAGRYLVPIGHAVIGCVGRRRGALMAVGLFGCQPGKATVVLKG